MKMSDAAEDIQISVRDVPAYNKLCAERDNQQFPNTSWGNKKLKEHLQGKLKTAKDQVDILINMLRLLEETSIK